MNELSRRSLLAGCAAAMALPRPVRAAETSTEERLRAVLEHAVQDRAGALAQLSGFDPATLPLPLRLDLLTARSGLAIDVELGRRFPFGRAGRSPYLVTPGSGAWAKADAPAETVLRETEALRADAARGVRLPADLLGRTIAAVETAQAAAQDSRAAALADQAAILRAQASDAPRVGVSHLPGGEDYFALLLRRTTGDDILPARLHERLVREQARTLARADRLFAQIGQRHGSVGARYSALWRDSRFLYPDDDAGRDAAVADMNRALAAVLPDLPAWFGPLPPEVLSARAARMPAAEAAAGKQGYRTVPDRERPGRYIVDLKDIRRRPRWTLPAVVHHELLPGHMVQLPLETRAAPHPLRIDYAASFVEGWAIYAEQRAASAGLYRGDPHGELGYCHWRLFRIERALADLGIHLHGWSLDTALAHWRETMGEPAYFAPFATDLDRIALEPAARAAEAAAWLAIEDLSRGRAPIPFHRALLRHGRARTDQLASLTRAA
ncbi:DUF885 family protein [uncultured Sphingomonas sp.]|uniref:DUF885 family protein n=1 Tax=uncultured Sphingomonas sp. TaxID=158754 RepID=UPI0025E70504|nr:DUF885 family protein [uncultured Sphingomonas sp.]